MSDLQILLAAIFVVLIVVAAIVVTDESQTTDGVSIDAVDQMTGVEFERFVLARFRAHGYRVRLTPASGDYGADLILERDGYRSVVQAKRYKRHVGVRAVQEVHAAVNYNAASRAMVVTNSYFTEAARKLALKTKVELLDRDALKTRLMWTPEVSAVQRQCMDVAHTPPTSVGHSTTMNTTQVKAWRSCPYCLRAIGRGDTTCRCCWRAVQPDEGLFKPSHGHLQRHFNHVNDH